jgi:hypothetical protein
MPQIVVYHSFWTKYAKLMQQWIVDKIDRLADSRDALPISLNRENADRQYDMDMLQRCRR